MTKNQEWEKVGGGSYGVYRPKKKEIEWGAIAVIAFWFFIMMALLSTCSG